VKVISTPINWVTGSDGVDNTCVKAYFRWRNCFAFSWNSDRNLIALGQKISSVTTVHTGGTKFSRWSQRNMLEKHSSGSVLRTHIYQQSHLVYATRNSGMKHVTHNGYVRKYSTIHP